jgi:XTP/dITP diphosphohydrolase
VSARFVLATGNPHKAAEIAAVFAAAEVDVELMHRPADVDDPQETGATLEDNARIKAIALAERTDLPAIADDTGLQVDALGGAPGVRTARYAGADATYADNCAKLVDDLDGLPLERRAARFVTVAIARWPDGVEAIALGTVDGVITDAPRGENGFGYDPVFVPVEGDGRTFAEMSAQEKQALSHRGEAFRTLAAALRMILAAEEA